MWYFSLFPWCHLNVNEQKSWSDYSESLGIDTFSTFYHIWVLNHWCFHYSKAIDWEITFLPGLAHVEKSKQTSSRFAIGISHQSCSLRLVDFYNSHIPILKRGPDKKTSLAILLDLFNSTLVFLIFLIYFSKNVFVCLLLSAIISTYNMLQKNIPEDTIWCIKQEPICS